ncbi:MAG: hypothetical protein Q9225_002588 [Loekoesia sp. 1 TL-2023]
MQNARYDSPHYQGAAANGIWTGNHRTRPELNLQPHARNMHGGAGGAGKTRNGPQPQNEPQAAGAFPQAAAARFEFSDDRLTTTTFASSDYFTDATNNNDPYHQPVSGSVDNALHHPFQVGAHFGSPYEGATQLSHSTRFNCDYPGCYAKFDNQWVLNEHSKVHTNNSIPQDGAFVSHGGIDNPLAMFPEGPVNTNNQTTYGQPVSYGGIDNVLGTFSGVPVNPYGQTMYGQPAPASAANMVDTVPQPAFTLRSVLPHDNVSFETAGAVTSKTLVPESPYGTSASIQPPTGGFRCSYPGCNTTCARHGDLHRHGLIHALGTKAFECPKPGCPRKGTNGFQRKDKMLSHVKVCQGRARGKYKA